MMTGKYKAIDFRSLYVLKECIGKGSFGSVYKSIEVSSGRQVAIKCIDVEDCESEMDEIFKEIAFLSSCSNECIIKYYGSGIVGHSLWIVTEYLGGGSVIDILNTLGALEEVYCQIILRDVLRALVYLHQRGKIHRDIKCANVLLNDHGYAKLADFGVSGQLSKGVTQRMTFVGTPYWMAPEIIKQMGHDQLADIWSLGITAIEMVDTKPPLYYEHPMKALLNITRDPPPEPQNVNISKAFKNFISLCLNKESKNRPSSSTLLKNKFIKGAKKSSHLETLVVAYKSQARSLPRDQLDEPILDNEAANKTVVKWAFDTVRIVDQYMTENIKKAVNATEKTGSSKSENLSEGSLSKASTAATGHSSGSSASNREKDIITRGIDELLSAQPRTNCLTRIFSKLMIQYKESENLIKNLQDVLCSVPVYENLFITSVMDQVDRYSGMIKPKIK